MIKATEKYGMVRLNSYIPSTRAIKMLNYFQSVGWHDCNSLYHQQYEQGIAGAFIIFTVGGKGFIRLDDKVYPLTAGVNVLVPPNTPMEYYTCDGSTWEFYWINLYGTYAIQTVHYILAEQESIFRISNITDCLDQIKYLIYLQDDNKFRFEFEVSQKIFELLQNIAKGLFLISGEDSQNDHYLMKIVAYIENHYAEPLHIKEVSENFHISQNQLIRSFLADIGYTPYEYLKRYRLLKACELLEMTNHPIAEIGALTGFQNSSNFIFQFKSQYNMTPLSYRKLFSPVKNR